MGAAAEVTPEVTIVVPHFRDFDRLDLCLDALSRQSFPADRVEIVVADNNSPEGPERLEQAIAGRARWVIALERGAGPARNAGAAAARGGILAFTDSDCVPDPEWLGAGLKVLERHGFVGGRMRVIAGEPATAAEAFEKAFAFDNASYVLKKGFTVTANLFVRKADFERVGGFKTGVSEDLEWSHRAVAAGLSLGYAEQAVVAHPARRDWRELKTKWVRINRETWGLYRDRRGGTLRWLARTALLPLSAVAHTPKALTSPELKTWRERFLALGELYRLRLWRVWHSVALAAEKREP